MSTKVISIAYIFCKAYGMSGFETTLDNWTFPNQYTEYLDEFIFI